MRTWFITGASRGLGMLIAKAALDAGDAVVATARNPNAVTEALGSHDNLLAVKLDVTDQGQANVAVAAAVKRFGRIDVLVNNAGFGVVGAVEEEAASSGIGGPLRRLSSALEALALLPQGEGHLGKHVECVLADAPGLVLGRILCQIVNESHFAVQEGIATAEDVDTAMRLGFNWPRGPFEWAEAIGHARVAACLDALHAELGEERYRVAPALRLAATRG